MVGCVSPLIGKLVAEGREEVRDHVASILLGEATSRPNPTKTSRDEQFAVKLFRVFSEVNSSLERLKDFETYLGRFPFAKTRVARSAYLRLMVEAHLNEIYILQERLEAMVKQVARAYRNDYLHTHIQQVTTRSLTVVAESLKPVVRARGAHVHEARHTNLDIERLELIELLKTSKDDVGKAIRKLQGSAVWDTHDRLKKQARNWNTGAAKVVEHVLVAIEAIVFEPDGDQLRFPRPAA